MDERLFNVIITFIPVIGAIITYFVVPYIKTAISTDKLEQYKEWASLAVKCAEMIFTEKGMGTDKKQYVVDFLNNMFNSKKVVLSEEQITVLIESAVKEMKSLESK